MYQLESNFKMKNKDTITRYDDGVFDFLAANNISPGDYPVVGQKLYDEYLKFCVTQNIEATSHIPTVFRVVRSIGVRVHETANKKIVKPARLHKCKFYFINKQDWILNSREEFRELADKYRYIFEKRPSVYDRVKKSVKKNFKENKKAIRKANEDSND